MDIEYDAGGDFMEEQSELQIKSQQLALLTRKKKQLAAELKETEALVAKEAQEVLALMRAQQLEKFTSAFGTFFTRTTERPAIVDKAKAFDWLRNMGLGGIIQETVNSNTLLSEYCTLRDAGKADIFLMQENGFNVAVKEDVGVHGA